MATRKASSKGGKNQPRAGKSRKPAADSLPPDPPASASPAAGPAADQPADEAAVDAYLRGLPKGQAEAAQRLRQILREAAPAARPMVLWSRAVWEQNGPFCWLQGRRSYLAFGFWRAAELRDPGGLLEGLDHGVAHVRIGGDGDVPEDALRDLLSQALELDRRLGDATRV